jgi:hypothetical protein
LCDKNISEGIYLSDGGIIHELCLSSIQNKQEVIRGEIIRQYKELDELQTEVKRRESMAFKIGSIFSRPDIATASIQKSMVIAENNIARLSNIVSSLQARLNPVYDYFLTYPPDWDKRRKDVYERDGRQCGKCGSLNRLHLHHIKPLSKGGSNEISNLKLLCEKCHSKEHGGRNFLGEFNDSETAFSKRIANIQYALKHGKRIKFGYKKLNEKSHKQRTVRPTELVNINHHMDNGSTLCVRGYCELRKAERIFALKRMRGLKVI